jgi:dTDP-4-amino-4,6-dideoxygalactose transaminase
MTEVAAAIGVVQLKKIERWTLARQKNASFLDTSLVGVEVPKVAPGAEHVYHQYTVKLNGHDRDRFASELRKLGVDNDVYYPTPVHELPAYREIHDLPVTKEVSQSCLSIPVHQNLTNSDLHRIAGAVNKLARAGS